MVLLVVKSGTWRWDREGRAVIYGTFGLVDISLGQRTGVDGFLSLTKVLAQDKWWYWIWSAIQRHCLSDLLAMACFSSNFRNNTLKISC